MEKNSSTAFQNNIFGFEKSDVKYRGYMGNHSRDQEIASITKEIEDLHHLDASSWSIKRQTNECQWGNVPNCIGSYNKERNMMRVCIDIEAPLIKVLTYMMGPPFGLRNMIVEESCNPEILERLGKGAVIGYNEMPGKDFCLFSIAARDCVSLSAVKVLSSSTAIFGVKSVDHKSRPVCDDAYRVNIPLMGTYLYAEGDVVHVESYFADLDIGGKLRKLGCCMMNLHWMNEIVKLAKAIPNMPDVTSPPYLQYL